MKNKLENHNDGSNYDLACIKCETVEKLHMVAHRNKWGNICGLLNVCDKCHKEIANCEVFVEDRSQPDATN